MFSLISMVMGAGASDTDISSVVVHLYLLEASSVICKDSKRSDIASTSFVLLELILSSRSYVLHVFRSTGNAVSFRP